MKWSLLIFLLLASFLSSCQQEETTVEMCEDWAMLAFQGKPFESRRLKDECGDFKMKYTKEICQKALQNFVMTGSQKEVKKVFGERIMGCFTSDDIKRFEKVNP